MRLVIEIDCENDAFFSTCTGKRRRDMAEARRILNDVVHELEHGNYPRVLKDINGNTVGRVRRLKSRKK